MKGLKSITLIFYFFFLLTIFAGFSQGSAQVSLAPAVKAFLVIDEPLFALTHVRIIDGTGQPPLEDQTIIISGNRIAALGPADKIALPAGIKVLDKSGYTVIPGLVGMHNHIFYPAGGAHYNTLEFSAPRLYLACGVTTIRTTGSLEPYTELNLKKAINEGRLPGPRMYVTSPYLEGPGAFTLQMNELDGPEDAIRFVQYWAAEGVDDFKVYTRIRRNELEAAIKEIHRLGKKVTAHLCSITFREAMELGIDNLEHGLLVSTDFVPGKKPDFCPGSQDVRNSLLNLEISSPQVQALIQELVKNKVAITSTLPVFEISVPGRPPLDPRVLEAMAPELRILYLTQRTRVAETKNSPWEKLLAKEMEFELAFARQGGLLLAGPDPTGYGGVLPGFGDQRELELLVEAGFSPVEAIKIATHNGALYLGALDQFGTIAVGKLADLVLIKGNPARNIGDIRNVEIVFKEGRGYDPGKLLESVRSLVGIR